MWNCCCCCCGRVGQEVLAYIAQCPFMSCCALILLAVAVARIAVVILKLLILSTMRLFVYPRAFSSFGEWALITGASDGIGRALCLELAKRGVTKFLLVGRNEGKLKDTDTQLRLVSPPGTPLEVRLLVIDFATESAEGMYTKVRENIEGLDVGVLVNNVGVSYPHAMNFDEVEMPLIEELLKVNVMSMLATTRAVLPGMKVRGRGLIVCVGSGSSKIPSDPLYAAYAATKASSDAFCRSLQVEVMSQGIVVQCHMPLLVTTKMSKCKTPSLLTPSAETYASAAITQMQRGCPHRRPVYSPYFIHAVLLWICNAMPWALWANIRLKQSLALRDRALKKKQEAKKSS